MKNPGPFHKTVLSIGAGLLFVLLWATHGRAEPEALPRLPQSVKPERYGLELTLHPSRDVFQGQVSIDVTLAKPQNAILLHASRELSLTQIRFETAQKKWVGQPELVGKDLAQLRFETPLPAGSGVLRILYTGRLPKSEGQGLYRETDGPDSYIYSHFEPISARRAFPCFDEPNFKVPWRVTLHVPKEHIALSNSPVETESVEPDAMKRVVFKPTPPLPSYLLAFAVGPFGVVEAGKAGKKNTPVRIVTLRGHENEARYAAKTTLPILSLLETYFGIPYPYEKLDEVAVPGMGGAMEHPGLITYGQGLIQIRPDEETVRARRSFAKVAAHELAHQWAGNLVTLAFWDDLWLNEALATFLESKIIATFQPDWKETEERSARRQSAMHSDSLASARQIRQPILSNDDIVNAFDGITYSKGAAVLGVFEHWLGEPIFKAGLQRYMLKHAHKTATTADLVGAWRAELADTAARDPKQAVALLQKSARLPEAVSSLLDQPGLPLLSVSLACEPGGTHLAVSQSRYLPLGTTEAQKTLYKIPVCFRYPGSTAGAENQTCEWLKDAQARFGLPNTDCPAYVVANPDARGYYRVRYAPTLERTLAEKESPWASVLRETERIAFLGDQAALLRTAQVPAADVLRLAHRFAQDPSRHVVAQAAQVWWAVLPLLEDAQLPAYRRQLLSAFLPRLKTIGFWGTPADADDVKILRGTLVHLLSLAEESDLLQQARTVTAKWLADRRSVDAETIRLALGVAAQHGDETLFSALQKAAQAETDRNQRMLILFALGRFQQPRLSQKGLDLVLNGPFALREAMALLWGPLGQRSTQHLPFQYVKLHFEELAQKLPKDAAASLSRVGHAFCSQPSLGEVQAFFTDRSTRYVGGPRILSQTLEHIAQCVALKNAQKTSLASALPSEHK